MVRLMKRKKGLDNYFKISERKSSVKVEIFAGITTFLAMAYILVVNPNNILWAGTSDPRFSSVFIATAIGSVIGCFLMALLANMPLAQAPSMGFNAIVGSIIGGSMGFAFSYGNAMAMIFASGIIFLLLSILPGGKDKNTGKLVSIREKIFDGVPKPIRQSIPVGIGLFIAFVGLQKSHIIVDNQFTLLSLIDFNNPENWINGGIACGAIVTLFGLFVITILSHYKVKGAVLIGIISSTLLAIPLGVADTSILYGKVPGISWKFWENIGDFFNINNGVFFSVFKDGFNLPSGSVLTFIIMVLTFVLIDLFDTMGTLIGCCKNANLLDKDGKPVNYKETMYCDCIATLSSSILGTSTVDTYVESGAGISEGGRTGLTALVVGILFILSLFMLPLFAFIPAEAAACSLIYVGVLMMMNVSDIDFTNIRYAVPSFLTIIIMLLAYSITDGMGIGIISFVVIDFVIYIIDLIRYDKDSEMEKPKLESNLVTFIVFILFLIYFLVPTMM